MRQSPCDKSKRIVDAAVAVFVKEARVSQGERAAGITPLWQELWDAVQDYYSPVNQQRAITGARRNHR